jgi:hypothetical protein
MSTPMKNEEGVPIIKGRSISSLLSIQEGTKDAEDAKDAGARKWKTKGSTLANAEVLRPILPPSEDMQLIILTSFSIVV